MGSPPHRLHLSLGRGRGAGNGPAGQAVTALGGPQAGGTRPRGGGCCIFTLPESLGLSSLQERSRGRLLNLLQICEEVALFSAFRSRAPSRTGREARWTVSKAPETVATEAGLPVALLPEGNLLPEGTRPSTGGWPLWCMFKGRGAGGPASRILQHCPCSAAPPRTPPPRPPMLGSSLLIFRGPWTSPRPGGPPVRSRRAQGHHEPAEQSLAHYFHV